MPIEGSAGGGIVPWAVLSGYSTREEWGPTGSVTTVVTDDYDLTTYALSINLFNRVELSAARQLFDIGALTGALGFDPGDLEQTILGAKFRVLGDVVYTRWPQVAVGLMYKRADEFLIPSAVGARDDSDIEFYAAATKVFLDGFFGRNVLLNVSLRSTRANQTGLLGFGGDRDGGRNVTAEVSAAVLLNPHWAVGYEFRQKPNNLSFAREDDWQDVFLAWFPNKHFAIVGAWADLGSVATLENQTGFYLSVQGGF